MCQRAHSRRAIERVDDILSHLLHDILCYYHIVSWAAATTFITAYATRYLPGRHFQELLYDEFTVITITLLGYRLRAPFRRQRFRLGSTTPYLHKEARCLLFLGSEIPMPTTPCASVGGAIDDLWKLASASIIRRCTAPPLYLPDAKFLLYACLSLDTVPYI